jgi:hypothetical protein
MKNRPINFIMIVLGTYFSVAGTCAMPVYKFATV